MKLSPALLAITLPFAALAACSKPAETPPAASPAAPDVASTDSAPGSTADQGGAVSGAQTNGAINADANAADTSTVAASSSFTESQARGHLENAGYSDVGPLTKTPDGVWTGKASKGGKSMTVVVDFKGAITAK